MPDVACSTPSATTTTTTTTLLYPDEISFKKLHPLHLKKMVTKSAETLAKDFCFPEETRKMFSCPEFSFTSNEASELWYQLREIIDSFNGDAEKFYSQFYSLFTNNLLPEKFERTDTNTLLAEVANHMLVHLSGTNIAIHHEPTKINSLSDKEIKSLQYLSGFILHKLHSKFRFSKSCNHVFNKQCILILQACKVENDNTQTLVVFNARDRGGLWKVNKKMQDVFLHCEIIFRSNTVNFKTSLVCKDLVQEMMKDVIVVSNFNSICSGVDPKVTKEISLNLLDHMITLFVRVRTFSFAKDVREKYKVAKKQSKKTFS